MRHSPELIRSLMHVVRLAVNHFRSQGNRHHGDMRPNPSIHRAQITTIRNQWAKCTTKTLPISAYPFNTTNDPFHPQVRPINDLPVHCEILKKQYEKLRREWARKRRKLQKLDRAAQAKQHVRQRLQEQSSETGGASDTASPLQQWDCDRDGDHKKVSVCESRGDPPSRQDHSVVDFQKAPCEEDLDEQRQTELNILHFGNTEQSNSPDSRNKKPLFKGSSKQVIQGEKLEQVSGICATKRDISGKIPGPQPGLNNDVSKTSAELCSGQEKLHTEENSQVVAPSQESLDDNMWVDGLMFPAEYYIRTTRGMQRQGRTPEGVARQVRARRQRKQKRKLGTNNQDTLDGSCGSKQARLNEMRNDDTMSLGEELSHCHGDKVAKDNDVSLRVVEDLKTLSQEDEKMQKSSPGLSNASLSENISRRDRETLQSSGEQVYITSGEKHLSTGEQVVSTPGEGQVSADADSQDSVIPDTQYSPLLDAQKCLAIPKDLLSEDAVQDKLHVLRKGRKALSSHNTPVQGSGLRKLVRRKATRSCQNSPVQSDGSPDVLGEGNFVSPQDWPQGVLSQGSLEKQVFFRRSQRLADRCSQETQTNASLSTPKQNHKVLKEAQVVKVPEESEKSLSKIQDSKTDAEVDKKRQIFPVLTDQLVEKLKNSKVSEFHLPYSDYGTLKVAKAREAPSNDLGRNCRSRHSNETDPKDVQCVSSDKEVQEIAPSIPRLSEALSRSNQSSNVKPSLSPDIRNTPKDTSKTEVGQEKKQSVFPSLSPMLHKKCTKEVLDFSLVGSEYVKLKLNKVKSSPRPAAATSTCRSTSGHGKYRQQSCKAKTNLPPSSTRSEHSSKDKDTSVKKDSDLEDVENKQQQKTYELAQENTSTRLSLLRNNKNEGTDSETQEPEESLGGVTDKSGEESTDTALVPSADHKQPVSSLETLNVIGSGVDITGVGDSERNIVETEPVSISVTPAQGHSEDSQGTGVEETPVLSGHEEVLMRTGVEGTGEDVTTTLPEFSACLQLTDEAVVSMVLGEATLQDETVPVLAVCQKTQLTLWVQQEQDWTPGACWDIDKEEEVCDVCLLSCEVGVQVLVGGNFPSGHLKLFYTDGASISSSLDHTWSGHQAQDRDGCHGDRNTDYHAMATVLPGGVAIATGMCQGGSSVCKLSFSGRDGHLDEQTRLAMPAVLRISSLCQVEGCEGCLLGTSRNQVLLWNHTLGVLLRCVDLPGVQPTCLYAAADQGLIFILLSSPAEQQFQTVCSLVSINPGTGYSLSLQKYSLSQGSSLGRCVQGCLGGSRLFVLQESGEVHVWDVFSSEMGSVLKASSRKPSCLTVDKNLLCLGTSQGCVHVYNL
ncbi:Partner and localizer of BRCA2 [Branchiostoma belcheri]|nr:Partner and localizer of BRCA2 [Branchiostoma belcheri]